jgi:(2Fe-2S) ferredoxin
MRGSGQLLQQLQQMAQAAALPVTITPLKCMGECECERGPNLRIAPGERFYHHLRTEDIPEVIDFLEELYNSRWSGKVTFFTAVRVCAVYYMSQVVNPR